MRVYGNLMNRIEEHAVAVLPAVGDGATIMHYSDRTAATVTRVTTSRRGVPTVFVKADHAVRTDTNGMSESQSYDYSPNPDAAEVKVRLRRLKVGKVWRTANGDGIRFGSRRAYHDYSF